MIRPSTQYALRGILLLILTAIPATGIRAEDPPVTVSAAELKALQEKAAEVERLKAQLQKAEQELKALKTAPAPVPPPPPPVQGKAPLWIPPAALRAMTNEPPPRPLSTLPPPGADTVLTVRELISYFSEDPAAAARRFRGQVVTVKGVVTDVRKSMFQALYDVNFRQLDTPLRVTASFRPPSEFTRVYATDDGQEVVGLGHGIRTVFARVGSELTVQGTCEGLESGAIRLSGCAYLLPAGPKN